jgi:hypothetical protein
VAVVEPATDRINGNGLSETKTSLIRTSISPTPNNTLSYEPRISPNSQYIQALLDGTNSPENQERHMEQPIFGKTVSQDVPYSTPMSPSSSKAIAAENPSQEHNDQPMLFELSGYLKVQDNVTMLRIELQQLRATASQARDELAKQESILERNLRESQTRSLPLKSDEYHKLLKPTELARNKFGPLEQDVIDMEFRVVGEESRLLRKGESLHRLISKRGNGWPMPMASSSLPPSSPKLGENNLKPRRASTIFSFESSSTNTTQQYVDPDCADGWEDSTLPIGQNPVEFYAPDLNFKDEQHSTGSAVDDPRELYVIHLPELEGFRANDEEHVGFTMTKQLPDKLPELYQLLGRFFTKPESHLKRWMLHFHHLRLSAEDMISSHSLNSRDMEEAFTWMDNMHEDWVGIELQSLSLRPTG